MKFLIEKKREAYIVFNEETGDVRGRFKERNEAKQFAKACQNQHEEGKKMVSARLTPPRDIAEDDD